MATPNYGYEKRQKELAKKRKNEEKLRLKAERKLGILPVDEGAETASNEAPGETAEPAPTAPTQPQDNSSA